MIKISKNTRTHNRISQLKCCRTAKTKIIKLCRFFRNSNKPRQPPRFILFLELKLSDIFFETLAQSELRSRVYSFAFFLPRSIVKLLKKLIHSRSQGFGRSKCGLMQAGKLCFGCSSFSILILCRLQISQFNLIERFFQECAININECKQFFERIPRMINCPQCWCHHKNEGLLFMLFMLSCVLLNRTSPSQCCGVDGVVK